MGFGVQGLEEFGVRRRRFEVWWQDKFLRVRIGVGGSILKDRVNGITRHVFNFQFFSHTNGVYISILVKTTLYLDSGFPRVLVGLMAGIVQIPVDGAVRELARNG